MSTIAQVQFMRHMGPGDDRTVHVWWKGQTRDVEITPLIKAADTTTPDPPAEMLPAEWTDDNPPWANGTLADFAQGWPSGLNVANPVLQVRDVPEVEHVVRLADDQVRIGEREHDTAREAVDA